MKNYASYFKQRAKQAKNSKRSAFLNYWRALSNLPLMIDPIPKDSKGSNRSEDGIRLTGSPRFIAAVMSRLKDVLLFDNPGSKVEIRYQESKTPKKNGERSYILYVNVHKT